MLSIFSRKKLKPFPFDRLVTDMHSHLLPGIDDGSPDPATSELLLKGMLDLGYSHCITTPHVMEDLYPNNPDTINASFDSWKRISEFPALTNHVRPAAEYLLDGNMDQLIEKKIPLQILKNKMVLVEISFASPPMHLKELLFQLQINGYQPVFAHPERYAFYHQHTREYSDIKSAGCLFQCNLLSFTGYYGSGVKQAAEWLVQKKMIDLLGTDLHHEKHLHHLLELSLTPSLSVLIEEQGLLNASLW